MVVGFGQSKIFTTIVLELHDISYKNLGQTGKRICGAEEKHYHHHQDHPHPHLLPIQGFNIYLFIFFDIIMDWCRI
jgi:hypothetical protein